MAENRKRFYAVAAGRRPGIYTRWFGPDGAEEQVRGFSGARYKGFATLAEAKKWLEGLSPAGIPDAGREDHPASPSEEPAKPAGRRSRAGFAPSLGAPQAGSTQSGPEEMGKAVPARRPKARAGRILVFTDGGSIDNPGPGGYGAVILNGDDRIEISGGFRRTTNNRMELMGCIAALSRIEPPGQRVVVRTDSRYVVDGITKGWAARWRRNGWMRNAEEPAENSDLWEKLLDLVERHNVRFEWIRGHAGHAENERCDALARAEAAKRNLPPDPGYEEKQGQRPHRP